MVSGTGKLSLHNITLYSCYRSLSEQNRRWYLLFHTAKWDKNMISMGSNCKYLNIMNFHNGIHYIWPYEGISNLGSSTYSVVCQFSLIPSLLTCKGMWTLWGRGRHKTRHKSIFVFFSPARRKGYMLGVSTPLPDAKAT